jgi:methionyl-tRNA formyltransferase
LQALVEGRYNVVAVVTQPDKPVRRHASVLHAPAVKVYAQEHGIPVMQPEKMKDEAFLEELRSYKADLQVVVAFRMLPEVVWAMPRFGTFNVHAALLPQYRGAAPINWAIINGETQTGVTTFFLDHEIDTGRIIMQKPFDIPDDADVEYVYDGLMALGAKIAVETIDALLEGDGSLESIPQAETEELHNAPKLTKGNCKIDWSWTTKQVYDFIRGLCPIPGAWGEVVLPDGTTMEMKIYKACKCEKQDAAADVAAGTLIKEKKHIYIMCGNGPLELLKVQPVGKAKMDAVAFANGLRI